MLATETQVRSIFNNKRALMFLGYKRDGKIHYNIKNCTGVVTLMRSRENDTYEVEVELISGQAELVLVSKEKIIPLSAKERQLMYTVDEKSRLRLLARQATLKIIISKR